MAKSKKKIEQEDTRPVGRPSDYTPELGEEICDAIATSSYGITTLCKAHEHWPDKVTIYRWIAKIPEFCNQYTQAKKAQAELMVDEMIEIADQTVFDTYVNDEGKLVPDHEYMQRSRLRIDTRKWMACKLIPKVYGDRVHNKVSGDEDGPPVKVESDVIVAVSIDERIKDLAGE